MWWRWLKLPGQKGWTRGRRRCRRRRHLVGVGADDAGSDGWGFRWVISAEPLKGKLKGNEPWWWLSGWVVGRLDSWLRGPEFDSFYLQTYSGEYVVLKIVGLSKHSIGIISLGWWLLVSMTGSRQFKSWLSFLFPLYLAFLKMISLCAIILSSKCIPSATSNG